MSVLEQLERQAEEAEHRAARLRKMVELVKELGDDGLSELVALAGSPESEGKTNGNGNTQSRSRGIRGTATDPRGRDAVRRIVRERPGIWTLPELRAEMEARGWFTSAKALENAAKRLCDINREGRRLGSGQYLFPADHEKEVNSENDANGASGAATLIALNP